MATVRTGRCLCGGVTVELTGEPFAVFCAEHLTVSPQSPGG